MVPQTKRSVLITGCTEGGAGNSLALELAASGLRVFATARSLKSMTNLSAKGIETLTLDVTSAESIRVLKDEITKRTNGKLDMLFNNAGALYEAPAIEADPTAVRRMFDTNVFGLFDVVTAFAPLLIAAVPSSSKAPTIINVASILARLPFPFSSAYNATKAAVAAYSDTLRLELEPLGVRVVTIYMGEVSTKLMLADNINFGPDSLYASVEHKVKERSEHHSKASMAAEAFAKQVVSTILGSNSTNFLWKGTNAFVVWLLNAIGPRKVFDGTMKGPSGLDDKHLVRKIYERGQQLAGKC